MYLFHRLQPCVVKPLADKRVVDIAVGSRHSMAIISTGKVSTDSLPYCASYFIFSTSLFISYSSVCLCLVFAGFMMYFSI